MPINNGEQLMVNRKLKWYFSDLLFTIHFQRFPQFAKTRNKMFGMKEVLITEDDYREALKRFLEICDAEENTQEAEELEQLMTILEIYEQENCS